MLSINTNLSSLIAQSSMKSSTNKLDLAIERMTTGSKINHAKDNAANYSISTNMTTQLNAYEVAADNVAMGMDLVNTASDVISQMQDKGERLRALATQARNGTYGQQSLDAINAEARSLLNELSRLYTTSEYNGTNLFNRKEYEIAEHLPRAGKSGFIDESALSATGPPQARAEYGGFIEDPHSYEQSYVDDLTAVSKVVQADGFTENEYKIASVADLVALSNLTNAGVDTTGKTFILAKDLDLGAYCAEKIAEGEGGWTPIGNYSVNNSLSFKGTFDGNGYTIKNLQIDTDSQAMLGLFGLSRGVIKNLAIIDAKIKTNRDHIGILAGDTNGTIENCYTIGMITSGGMSGGLVGYAANCTFKNCYSNSEITGTYDIGGLVGYLKNQSSSVTGCYAEGKIIASSAQIGGLIGIAEGSVLNSYSIADIETTGGSIQDNIGGLIGYFNNSSGTISNCFSEGNINVNGNNVGGLLGTLISGTLVNCYSKANVTAIANTGGLLGYCETNGLISNCYSEGDVTATQWVGGLIGNCKANVENSYSAGNVYAYYCSGGLIGRMSNPSGARNINNCASYVKEHELKATDSISNGDFIGQIIVTTDEVNFGTLNISNSETISVLGNDIGECFKQISSTDTVIPGYDKSSMIAGISNVLIKDTSTGLQVGTYNDVSSRISFNSNFDFDLSTVERDISTDKALQAIDDFTKLLSEKSTQLGAIQNRLDSALESIEVNINNLASSRSTIRDADIAEVSAEYIQQQILQQASATLMSTANQSPSIALQLI